MSDRAAARGSALQAGARGAVALFAYFAAALLAASAGGVDGESPVEAQLLVHGAGCLSFCLVAAWLPPRATLTLTDGAWRGVALAPAFYLLFLLVWVPFVLFVYTWLVERLSIPFEPQDHLSYFGTADRERWQFVAALATVVVVGPLAEEFAFRGYGRDLLASLFGVRLALYGVAAVFGLFHGVALALPIALLGLLFGWLRERYRSLAAPLVAHALHNGLTVSVMLAWPEVLTEAYR